MTVYCDRSDLPRRMCSLPCCTDVRATDVDLDERAEAMYRLVADGSLITREQAWTKLGIEHVRRGPDPSPAPAPAKRDKIDRDGSPTGPECMNGCETLAAGGDELEPVRTHPPYVLCDACVERLDVFLENLRIFYPRLRDFLEPGSVDPTSDPDMPKGARDDHTVVPLRVAVLDLIDERHQRVVEQLDNRFRRVDPDRAPLANVRGVTGVLQRWAEQMRAERHGTSPPSPTFDTELGYVDTHIDYALSRPWAPRMFDDLRKVQSRVLDAAGVQRRRVIGYCDTLIDDPDTDEPPFTCAGPMFPLTTTFGVFCARCHRRYGIDELTPGHRRPLVTRRLTNKEHTA